MGHATTLAENAYRGNASVAVPTAENASESGAVADSPTGETAVSGKIADVRTAAIESFVVGRSDSDAGAMQPPFHVPIWAEIVLEAETSNGAGTENGRDAHRNDAVRVEKKNVCDSHCHCDYLNHATRNPIVWDR